MIKLKDILFESDEFDVLKPRRNREERDKNYQIVLQKQIQDYIKNGSKGTLNLDNVTIQSLPDNLTKVGGDLYLINSKVTKLPENIRIDGSLFLNNSLVTEMPENIFIGYGLSMDNTSISKLPNSITELKYLNMNGSKVTELPPNLKTIHGDLSAEYTPLIKLPDNLYIGGRLYITGTPIQRLPDNLTVGYDIRANRTRLSELPRNLVVGRDFELVKTPLAIKYTAEQLEELLPRVKRCVTY